MSTQTETNDDSVLGNKIEKQLDERYKASNESLTDPSEEEKLLDSDFPTKKNELQELRVDYEPSDDGSRDGGEDDKTETKCFCLRPQWQVYISHFLSSWGDRMWMFAGGLFLIEITPGSLRLVAIFEVSQSLTVILLGAAVGRWVDKTSRLSAAQLSLILQNVMVCACTLLLCLMISYRSFFTESVHGWGDFLAQSGVVVLACLAQIGTLGSKLTIEKDWIIIISEDCGANLATMNSVLRSVDLSSEMIAPVLVGFVMTSAGMVIGGIVIAVWNVLSLSLEYGLLHSLYYRVAALRRPKEQGMDKKPPANSPPFNLGTSIKSKVKESLATWKLYFSHNVRNAGLGLAFLYMTVLALDNYSRVYVYESGVSKAILGVLTACASVCGILGSICFPLLKKKIGILKTGVFGFGFQFSCLLLCVASVFLPGTRFGPFSTYSWHETGQERGYNLSTTFPDDDFIGNGSAQVLSDGNNVLGGNDSALEFANEGANGNGSASVEVDFTSVSFLLTGIISSRFGLWLADLTITQILQEEVSECERGAVNGVQSSLNQSFSLVRSLLLVVLPTIETFGYLILVSVLFVFVGMIQFCVYAYRKRSSEAPPVI